MKKEREIKASVILSETMHQMVQAACACQDMTFCAFIRRMIREHLNAYLDAPGGSAFLTRWAGAAPDDPLGEAVAAAARWWRLTPADMARLIVSQHILEYLEQGRSRWEAAQAAVQAPAVGMQITGKKKGESQNAD